jgi:hypothetical protein
MSIDPAHPPAPAPIALFDSGIGGLTVLQAVRRRLPAESLLYLADTLHMPYGEKSADWIVARSLALCELLLAQGGQGDRRGLQHRHQRGGRDAAPAFSRCRSSRSSRPSSQRPR